MHIQERQKSDHDHEHYQDNNWKGWSDIFYSSGLSSVPKGEAA